MRKRRRYFSPGVTSSLGMSLRSAVPALVVNEARDSPASLAR